MNRKLVITASVIAMIAGSVGLNSFFKSMKKEPPKRPPVEFIMNVKASKVKYETVNFDITASGRVLSGQPIDISSEVQGMLLAGDINFKKGENFNRGEVLARVFSKEAEYNLKSSKSRFLNSLASILPDLKIDFPESYEAWKQFFNETDISKPMPKLPEITDEKEKIFLSSRNILSDYYTIQSTEVRLTKYAIYAPFVGSISEVYTEIGSIANPGTRLARLIRTDQLEIEVPLDINDAKFIRLNDRVKIYSEDGLQNWDGKVIRKSKFVNADNQSISVFVKINQNGNPAVYAGQYLKVNFHDKLMENCMEIPRNAVFNYNEVFIVEDGKLRKATIDVVRLNEKTLLFKGLAEDKMVVSEPLINPRENTKVRIINANS